MITPQILAMYLNCQIQITTESATFNKRMVGIYFDSWFNQKEELTIQAEIGDRVVAYKANQCKLILRPLSSMTEEEEREMIATQDDVKLEGYPEILLKADSGKTFLYMLSKGFDLFNLIEQDLAIDSSKL